MMRYLNKDQVDLYQQYSRLSEKIVNVSIFSQEKTSLSTIWELISKEGIWKLPISKQYGGHGLSWQECIVALDGFFSNYSSVNCLALFMSQVSSLYLISQYGSESIKKRFLPNLILGKMACFVISEQIHKLLHRSSFSNKNKNQILYMNNNKIFIKAEKNEDDVVFYIYEKNLNIMNSLNAIRIEKNKFIGKERGLSALRDLIYFERLCYGIFSANYVHKLNISETEQ